MTRPSRSPLVSIGLPVRNGAATLAAVVDSVLAQTHADIELVISDNASTDGTEEIARQLARDDTRVVYQRHPANIGILNNFMSSARTARGDYVRWIGDHDSLEPGYVARTLERFQEDERRVLVTTQIRYTTPDEPEILNTGYDPSPLASLDPVERFAEVMHLVTSDFSALDPLYGMIRRDALVVPRRNVLGEDEVFAARLALAGPWGHVAEPLAHRHRDVRTGVSFPLWLGVPAWHWHVRSLRQAHEVSYWVARSSLDPAQRRRVRVELLHMYARRKANRMRRAVVKLRAAAGSARVNSATELAQLPAADPGSQPAFIAATVREVS